jgi:hypothetical protein
MRHVVETGDIYAAARQLMAEGASPDDTIATTYRGKPSMTGNVGQCAKLTVSETSKGGLRLVKWRPFPEKGVSRGAVTVKDGQEDQPGV